MYSKIYSYAAMGLEAEQICVEATILSGGFPSFTVSGLRGESSLQLECRLRAALHNSGYKWPQGRILLGLSPAWLRSEGSAYDFPIAMAILEASKQIIRPAENRKIAFCGELSQDGSLCAVPGSFSCLEKAAAVGDTILALPRDHAEDAGYFPQLKAALCGNLEDGVDYFRGLRKAVPAPERKPGAAMMSDFSPWSQFAGQQSALLALELACAGWHPLLLLGSPGCGKTYMASLARAMLPALEEDEERILRKIYSLTGRQPGTTRFERKRPFLQPHHSVSPAALTGGGNPPRPGLFSYAHKGILFLDEIMEIRPERLDLLRGPLESGQIELARAAQILRLPADFLLIGAGNPCRCGYALEDGGRACHCSELSLSAYRKRLSGPLLQRFHLRLRMQRPKTQDLLQGGGGSQRFLDMKARIEAAWQIQKDRAEKLGLTAFLNGRCPDELSPEKLGCSSALYRTALTHALDLGGSARGLRQLLLLARTAADLDGRERICEEDILLVRDFIAWESPS